MTMLPETSVTALNEHINNELCWRYSPYEQVLAFVVALNKIIKEVNDGKDEGITYLEPYFNVQCTLHHTSVLFKAIDRFIFDVTGKVVYEVKNAPISVYHDCKYIRWGPPRLTDFVKGL